MEKPPQTGAQTALVVLAFLAIYLVWGSTYLAIRYAVEGIPALLVAGSRHLIAGAVLCVWAWRRGEKFAPRQWRSAIVLGVLFFLIGHGSLHWAEQFVPSGLAAVLIATEPVMIAVLQPAASGKRRSGQMWVGFALGLAGVVLLMDTRTGGLDWKMLTGSVVVLAGAFSWAIGVVYSRRVPATGTPLFSAAMPMLCGGTMLYAAAALHGDVSAIKISLIPAPSLAALGYLTVFGSILAFTAYMWLLDRYPPELVATHTYANPVLALLLGWIIAGEPLNRNLVVACVFILGSIAIIRSAARAELAVPPAIARSSRPLRVTE